MPKFYVTYGFGYKQRNCYSVIEADDYDAAIQQADSVTQGHYAFLYDEHRFKGQAERYGLTEIPLQKQEKIDEFED